MVSLKNVIKEGQISLILDRYDDIFSDFDPRGYLYRALSEDFLSECLRATRNRDDEITLRLMIPKKVRDSAIESSVTQRLHHHFQSHYHLLKKKRYSEKKFGGFLFFLGSILITFAAYLHTIPETNFWLSYLIVLLEPAGWFTIWNGFDYLFLKESHEEYDLAFYKKMHKAQIVFVEY